MGIPLQSGGRTLQRRKYSGDATKTFLLAETSIGGQQVNRSCTAYVIVKSTTKKKGSYTPLPTPDKPWESISMDYMSGLPSTKWGNDSVFVIVDRFSKMVILVACKKSIIAKATTKFFFEFVWVHFGIPQTIVSYWDS